MSNLLEEVVKENGGVSRFACKIGKKYEGVRARVTRSKNNLVKSSAAGMEMAVELFLVNGEKVNYSAIENGVLIQVKIERIS